MDTQEIQGQVKDFILKEFLPGESADGLNESTPLVTGGILDSLATLKLVLFLEETYGVTFEAHDLDAEHLDTIATIAKLVLARKRAA
jgi:acyl carrier protein